MRTVPETAGSWESRGSVQVKTRMEQPSSKYATGNRGGNDHSSAFPAVWQTLEWVQFPDSHAGVRTGTALPWSSTELILGMCSGAPLRQGLSLLPWNHPALWQTPEGQGEVTPSPEHSAVWGSRAADPQETREAERSLLSWEALTAWMADKPPTQLGSELRACPGE